MQKIRYVRSFSATLGIFLFSSCSFLIDTDAECNLDTDCDDTEQCVAQYCVDIPGDVIEVRRNITANTTWQNAYTYVLTTVVFVEPGVTLKIDPGTTILGSSNKENPSALVVARGAQIDAVGTKEQPIVFTSEKPVGSRARGDWGGVVLLGDSRLNTSTSTSTIEGVPDLPGNEGLRNYGGFNETQNSTCGKLEYVRIEFAGFALTQGNEINGLTLGGCGRGTTIDRVQVHLGADDGIEIFGGQVNIKRVLITRADDDGLDWDEGWTGAGQYIAITQDLDGDNGIEADNGEDRENDIPRSNPVLSNLTIVSERPDDQECGNPPTPAGQFRCAQNDGNPNRGIYFRHGTAGRIYNSLIVGHQRGAFDIDGEVSINCALKITGQPLLPNGGSCGGGESPTNDGQTFTRFFGMAVSSIGSVASAVQGTAPFVDIDIRADNPDDGFPDEFTEVTAIEGTVFTDNPFLDRPTNISRLEGLIPNPSSPLGNANAVGYIRPPVDEVASGNFFEDPQFIGAFAPGASGNDNWIEGWTTAVEN